MRWYPVVPSHRLQTNGLLVVALDEMIPGLDHSGLAVAALFISSILVMGNAQGTPHLRLEIQRAPAGHDPAEVSAVELSLDVVAHDGQLVVDGGLGQTDAVYNRYVGASPPRKTGSCKANMSGRSLARVASRGSFFSKPNGGSSGLLNRG